MMIASWIWVQSLFGWRTDATVFITLSVTLMVALLMVSDVKYRTFKDVNLKGYVRFTVLIFIVLLLALFAYKTAITALVVLALYVLSGPVGWLLEWRKSTKKAHKNHKKTKK